MGGMIAAFTVITFERRKVFDGFAYAAEINALQCSSAATPALRPIRSSPHAVSVGLLLIGVHFDITVVSTTTLKIGRNITTPGVTVTVDLACFGVQQGFRRVLVFRQGNGFLWQEPQQSRIGRRRIWQQYWKAMTRA